MPVPTVRANLVAPEPLLRERSFLRIHNRAAKDALRAEAEKHHKERIPGHFTRSAAQKYGHMRRTPRYMRMKARRWGSVTDLVKTGDTKDEMTQNAVIRVGGKAADADGTSGELRVTIELRFPFGRDAQKAVAKAIRTGKLRRGHTSGAHRSGVTIRQMRKEIASITDAEHTQIARGFLRRYGENLASALSRAPRIRKRVQAAKAGGAGG